MGDGIERRFSFTFAGPLPAIWRALADTARFNAAAALPRATLAATRVLTAARVLTVTRATATAARMFEMLYPPTSEVAHSPWLSPRSNSSNSVCPPPRYSTAPLFPTEAHERRDPQRPRGP